MSFQCCVLVSVVLHTATDGVCMENVAHWVCVCLSSARDADERENWIHALEGTILRHTLQLRVCNHCTYLYMW